MKRVIYSFILLILLASVHSGFGQNAPKAVLVDSFPRESCDPLVAKVEAFIRNVNEVPNARGLIVINGEKGNYIRTLQFEQLIRNSIKSRMDDPGRISIAASEDEAKPHLQLWNVPAGAVEPAYVKGRVNFNLAEIKKPFRFTTKGLEDGVCPPFSDLSFYSQVLLANPSWRARLVIYEQSPRKFRQTETELINELIKDNKVPRNRISTLQYKRKSETSIVEFWLVPPNKK